jgi:putative NADH-flavin reductase
MNVVLYGATGKSGSRILQELVSRGHKVTAVARDTSKLPSTVPMLWSVRMLRLRMIRTRFLG